MNDLHSFTVHDELSRTVLSVVVLSSHCYSCIIITMNRNWQPYQVESRSNVHSTVLLNMNDTSKLSQVMYDFYVWSVSFVTTSSYGRIALKIFGHGLLYYKLNVGDTHLVALQH